jgi:ABC-type phosphate transport system substrate-binding protein
MESNTLQPSTSGKTDMKRSMLLCLVVVFSMASLCAARDLAIITDKSNLTSTVSSSDLLKLLKNDMQKWPDGRKVTIFLSNPSSSDAWLLFQKIYNMSVEEARKFADSHKDSIVLMGADDLVLKAVAQQPGSIGVVNVYSLNSSVKVMKVDGKLPFEQGYLLHGN